MQKLDPLLARDVPREIQDQYIRQQRQVKAALRTLQAGVQWPATHKRNQDRIAYALYGSAHSMELELWNQTWLRGKPHVFIPDAPAGPWAHLFKPLHTGRRGANSLFRWRTDTNMIWAVDAANKSFPNARWVLVCDADAFLFEKTILHTANQHDWRSVCWSPRTRSKLESQASAYCLLHSLAAGSRWQ